MKLIKAYVVEWRVILSVWAYVVVFGLVLQKVIIPFTPWHGGSGLLADGDWIYFQKVAVQYAMNIRQIGWEQFYLRPEGQGPSGMASFIYALTGVYEPWILLPVNGLIYALAALGLYWIVLAMGARTRTARYALLPMFLFPSLTMVWGQLHKDVWTIAAVLMLLAFWTRLFVGQAFNCRAGVLILFFSNAILWWMRPYMLQMIVVGQAVMLLVLSVASYKNKRILPLFVGVAAIAITFLFLNPKTIDLKKENEAPTTCIGWPQTWSIPYLERAMVEIACARSRLFEYSQNAGSNLDSEIAFSSIADVVAYAPRAAQIGFFAPFPDMWFPEKASYKSQIFRAVSAVEISVMYTAFLGVLLQFGLILSSQSCVSKEQFFATVALIFFSLIWVDVYALTTGNIGSIYRVRFPMMLLWIGMGVLAWQRVLGWLELRKQRKYG